MFEIVWLVSQLKMKILKLHKIKNFIRNQTQSNNKYRSYHKLFQVDSNLIVWDLLIWKILKNTKTIIQLAMRK